MTEVEKRMQTVIKTEKVNITKDGKAALLGPSNGDMRPALNKTAVYTCTPAQAIRTPSSWSTR